MLRKLITKNVIQKNRDVRRRAMQLESLETRCVLSGFSYTFNAVNGALKISGTEEADKIVITETRDGFVKVNGFLLRAAPANGAFTLTLSNVQTIVVNGGNGRDTIDARGISGLKSAKGKNTITLNGNDGDDTIYGTGKSASIINGGRGDDNLTGGAFGDTIHGNDGNDIIRGLGGNDKLYGDNGDDAIFGGTGDDWMSGGADDDQFDGGTGIDTAVLGSSGAFGDAVVTATTEKITGKNYVVIKKVVP
jgi:Ca2+-binding RTX toxin-like protein